MANVGLTEYLMDKTGSNHLSESDGAWNADRL